MEQKELYVVDKDGTVIDKIEAEDKYVKLSDGDRVLRKGTIQYLADSVDIKYYFIKINPLVFGEIARKYSMISEMIKYLGYMDNKLVYKNGKYLKVKDLPKLCGLSSVTVKRQLSGMTKDDIIHKFRNGKSKGIIFNPFIAYVGKKIFLSTYEDFKLSVWRSKCEMGYKK